MVDGLAGLALRHRQHNAMLPPCSDDVSVLGLLGSFGFRRSGRLDGPERYGTEVLQQIRRVGVSGSVEITAFFADALPAVFLLFTNNTSTHPILPILRLDCNECFRAKLGHLKRESFRRSTWPLCRSR